MKKNNKVKKSDALKGAENIKNILEVIENNPNAIISLARDYYKGQTIKEAYKDICMRQRLGAETKADHLLLSIIAFSMMAYS